MIGNISTVIGYQDIAVWTDEKISGHSCYASLYAARKKSETHGAPHLSQMECGSNQGVHRCFHPVVPVHMQVRIGENGKRRLLFIEVLRNLRTRRLEYRNQREIEILKRYPLLRQLMHAQITEWTRSVAIKGQKQIMSSIVIEPNHPPLSIRCRESRRGLPCLQAHV